MYLVIVKNVQSLSYVQTVTYQVYKYEMRIFSLK